MHNRFRRFLLIFMMLALPVQAFASAAMLGCEYLRIGSPAHAPADLATLNHHAMGHHADSAMSSCHEASDEQPDTPAGAHKCSHCAACYLAAACPIPFVQTSQVIAIPTTAHLHQSKSFNGFIPEGPERPPRTFLI